MKHRVIPSGPDITSVESRNPAPAIKIGIFILFLVVIDQLTKLFTQSFLQTQINTGSFLGLYIGKFPLFSMIIASVALIILLADIIGNKRIGLGETLILAGGLSNIIDRGLTTGVVDWIRFFGLWFNLADIYITFGIVWIIIKTVNNSTRPRRVIDKIFT